MPVAAFPTTPSTVDRIDAVQDVLLAPPATAVKGVRYLVADPTAGTSASGTATGAFAGALGKVAIADGSSGWTFEDQTYYPDDQVVPVITSSDLWAYFKSTGTFIKISSADVPAVVTPNDLDRIWQYYTFTTGAGFTTHILSNGAAMLTGGYVVGAFDLKVLNGTAWTHVDGQMNDNANYMVTEDNGNVGVIMPFHTGDTVAKEARLAIWWVKESLANPTGVPTLPTTTGTTTPTTPTGPTPPPPPSPYFIPEFTALNIPGNQKGLTWKPTINLQISKDVTTYAATAFDLVSPSGVRYVMDSLVDGDDTLKVQMPVSSEYTHGMVLSYNAGILSPEAGQWRIETTTGANKAVLDTGNDVTGGELLTTLEVTNEKLNLPSAPVETGPYFIDIKYTHPTNGDAIYNHGKGNYQTWTPFFPIKHRKDIVYFTHNALQLIYVPTGKRYEFGHLIPINDNELSSARPDHAGPTNFRMNNVIYNPDAAGNWKLVTTNGPDPARLSTGDPVPPDQEISLSTFTNNTTSEDKNQMGTEGPPSMPTGGSFTGWPARSDPASPYTVSQRADGTYKLKFYVSARKDVNDFYAHNFQLISPTGHRGWRGPDYRMMTDDSYVSNAAKAAQPADANYKAVKGYYYESTAAGLETGTWKVVTTNIPDFQNTFTNGAKVEPNQVVAEFIVT